VHSASSGKHVLVTVHAKRGKEAMDAAGVLSSFAGIACHDAWAPYDSYQDVAGHALCNAHVLRELVAVTENGTEQDKLRAQQAIDALLALKDAAGPARAAGQNVIDPAVLERHSQYFRDAAETGIAVNAVRSTSLCRKRHALAARIRDRHDDYLRFAHDLRVPFDNDLASHCTSWVRSAVSGFSRWSGRVAGVVLSIACGTYIFRQRAAEVGVVAAS
jgi:transposase